MEKLYTVALNNDGDVTELVTGTFEEIKTALVEKAWDLFNWILDNEPNRELPNFAACHSIGSLESTLNDYDYNWWTVSINY